MLYIKYSKDKAKLQEVTQADSKFRALDQQAAEVINVTTNSRLRYPEGKRKIDMCMAIEEMRMDSIIESAVETYQEFNLPLQETIQCTANKFNGSMEQAEKDVQRYWKSEPPA